MDLKQEINLKTFIFTLPHSFFYCFEATEKLTITVTLVQELGIDTMVWGWIQLKMSDITCQFFMFKLILQNLKVY